MICSPKPFVSTKIIVERSKDRTRKSGKNSTKQKNFLTTENFFFFEFRFEFECSVRRRNQKQTSTGVTRWTEQIPRFRLEAKFVEREKRKREKQRRDRLLRIDLRMRRKSRKISQHRSFKLEEFRWARHRFGDSSSFAKRFVQKKRTENRLNFFSLSEFGVRFENERQFNERKTTSVGSRMESRRHGQKPHHEESSRLAGSTDDAKSDFSSRKTFLFQKVNTNKMFLVALKRNQIEFVKLFLDNDLSLTEAFRNDPNLENLYQETQDKVSFDKNRKLIFIFTIFFNFQYADLTRNSIQSSSDMYRQIIYPLLGDQFDLRKVVNSSKKIGSIRSGKRDFIGREIWFLSVHSEWETGSLWHQP